jgi:YD repeat-containing protein
MKNKMSCHGPAFMLARLLSAIVLLLVAFGANAENGDGICFGLYPKSGAIQGTSSCPLIASSNTPVGMATYRCTAELPVVKRWCAAPPDDTSDDRSCPVADPVYASSGATTLSEVDFHSGDDRPFVFRRTYRARPVTRPDSGFGSLWFHNWQRQLNLTAVNGAPSRVVAYRENGSSVSFSKASGAWRPTDGTPLTLAQSSSSWTLNDLTDGSAETYSAQGILLSVADHDGRITTLTYSDSNTPGNVAPAPGLLVSISEHAAGTNPYYDLAIRLTYDAKWRITQMGDSTGNVTQYGYDTYNNLVSVTWPDGNVRRYVYEDTRFASALTGVIDETGSRISTWTYDANGRATAVSHPDTTRNASFAYGRGATTVTSSQRATTVNFSPFGGTLRPTGNDAGYSMGWDAVGNLTTDIAPYDKNVQYVYDEFNRPTQATVHNKLGLGITTVRYADSVSLRPYMVASSGWLRTYVYDSNGNVTGISERPTTDSTGASGFDARLGDGISRSYGLVYNSANQVTFAQMYEDGRLTGEWGITQDQTGNLRSILDRKTGTSINMRLRDTAHRVITIEGPGFFANPAYDIRGRLTTFQYQEYPGPLNGNVKRFLKVNYTYSADGRVVGRTATVSTNLGPDVSIGSDEIDKWLDNFESGVAPAGPPVNLLGWVKALQFVQEQGLEPVCPECAIASGARFAWLVYQLAKDPMWVAKNGIQQATEAKQCKPTGANNAGNIRFQTTHYASRLEQEGVNVADAQSEVADIVNNISSDMTPNTDTVGRMTVDGVLVEWRAFMLPDGTVSVGTIFPVR